MRMPEGIGGKGDDRHVRLYQRLQISRSVWR